MSQHHSEFPINRSGLNYALSNEPVLLNGMKILFDQPASAYPVSLETKAENFLTWTIPKLENLAVQKNQYSQPFSPPARSRRDAVSADFPATSKSPEVNGLLPKDYSELEKNALGKGLFGIRSLGLTDLNENYKSLIKEQDFEKAFYIWKRVEAKLAALSDEINKHPDKVLKILLWSQLSDAHQLAKEKLEESNSIATAPKSRIPLLTEEEEKQDEPTIARKIVGQYGGNISLNLLTDEEEAIFKIENSTFLETNKPFLEDYPIFERFLKEAWKYKKLFENSSEAEIDEDGEEIFSLKEASVELFNGIQQYVEGRSTSVQARIDIDELMSLLRASIETELITTGGFDEKEIPPDEAEYKSRLEDAREFLDKIKNGKEIGYGKNTIAAMKIAKVTAKIGVSVISQFDTTGTVNFVVNLGKAAKSIYSTLEHIKNLKYLRNIEPSPYKWREIIDFILSQKKYKLGIKATSVVPVAGTAIGGSATFSDRINKKTIHKYAGDLIDAYYLGNNCHAGLIILELVGRKNLRTTILDREAGVKALAAKMTISS